jgi:hypothetical protein
MTNLQSPDDYDFIHVNTSIGAEFRFTAITGSSTQQTINVWREGQTITPDGVTTEWVNFDCFTMMLDEPLTGDHFKEHCGYWMESATESDARYQPYPIETNTLLYG